MDHQTVAVKAIKTLEAAFYVVCEKKTFDVLELSDEGKAMVAAGCTPEVTEWSRRVGATCTCEAGHAKHLCRHGLCFHACSSLLLLISLRGSAPCYRCSRCRLLLLDVVPTTNERERDHDHDHNGTRWRCSAR